MSLNNNFKYSNVVNELNLIFKNVDDQIKKLVSEIYNIKTRNRDLKYSDTLVYKFLYSQLHTTKLSIVSSQNFINNEKLTLSAYNYRDNQIPVSFYKKLYYKISNLYKKLMNIDNNKPLILTSDGTFNNINSKNLKDNIETSLNMGYYDITNDLPLELSLEGEKDKNNELFILKKYIKQSNLPKNSILVLDRAYCSYEFIDFLIKNKYRFIIRFRNNCKNFNKIKNINNIRILKYFDEFKNTVSFDKFKKYVNKKKNKGKFKMINKDDKTEEINYEKLSNITFKSADIIIKYEYTLLTNLNITEYNDNKIKDLYKQRWNIEIFFKLLKYNFKFEHLIEHNKLQNTEQYQKLYLINLIVIYISKIIDKTYLFNNKIKKNFSKFKKGKEIKCVYKSNKSNIIKGVYTIIFPLIKGKLKEVDFKNICELYVKYSVTELGLLKERKAKTPFLKWYVKGHSNRSLLYKFIEAFLLKNDKKLNKNHKVLFKTCKITLRGLNIINIEKQ